MYPFVCLLFLISVSGQVVTVAGQTACHLGADVALVFDIGPGITDDDQAAIKEFGVKMVKMASDNALTLMSLISYDTEARERVTLKEWCMSEAREQIFDVFTFWNASTDQTHRAMDLMREQTFSVEYGGRDALKHVAIILTDRPSMDPVEAGIRAANLKATGAIVYVLTVGSGVPDDESLSYATSQKHILNIAGFSDLPVDFARLKNLAFDCSSCPDGWIQSDPTDPYCYYYNTDRLSWSGAKDYCVAQNAELIMFTSVEQVNWITEEYFRVMPNQNLWIGLARSTTSASFQYVDQTQLDENIISWQTGSPGNKLCVAYNVAGMKDRNCGSERKSLCMRNRFSADDLATSASCAASSIYAGSYSCEKAIDGLLLWPHGEEDAWATRGEGAGSWIKIQLAQLSTLKCARLVQRRNSGERYKDIQLEFSDGSQQNFVLPFHDCYCHVWDEINLDPVTTDRVTITGMTVYSKSNLGWAEIELYAVACSQLPPLRSQTTY